MKNILLENMLRFGTKNIDATTLKKIIKEQQSFANDPNYEIFYSKLQGKSKQYWDGKLVGPDKQPLSDADKSMLYQIFLQKAQKKATILKKDIDKVISRQLENVSIGVSPAEVKSEVLPSSNEDVAPPLVLTGTWPPVKDPAKLSNFYLEDNIINVSPENIKQFQLLIQDLIANVPKNFSIETVLVYAGASTSQVPTKYKGGDYGSDIKMGQQNNNYLVQDRCTAITDILSELVKQTIPNFTGKITVDPPQLAANSGTPYTTKERSYFFSTGKLDPTKKSQYDKMYGPLKEVMVA